MSTTDADVQMHVGTLYRYPVKSMLGEAVDALFIDERGVEGDRRLALIDEATGRVASAKQARLWRALLTCSATMDAGRVSIQMPDGVTMAAEADEVDARLSKLLARQVHLAHSRPPGASVERADPEQVLEFGLDAEVEAPLLELAEATPGASFTDYAPVHAITTATLERIDIDAERYRPNLVIVTPPGFPPYAENEWTGRTLAVGQARLRSLGPTPRCVIPTLEHGRLGRAPQAIRTPASENRVSALDMGVLPCAGAYFEVVAAATIRVGDRVSLGE
ncbi:molybdenum cofactor biosynthesis protein [Mycobacterium antarcticum]|uniref:MOSC domain-containing protein n=1 Tax=unclassified Mycolicibacterium TaxID=2636767 RepID=UPI0023950787|nr:MULTISPECIES: MOSC N-terminal beta barrel domain-containing protein [unclassified Mycolicibacterium]BDX34315.1 molybdenum cofactor biosynthesis protein [Mycolicibacterium sp. TUM20985]GLP82079.1 molybdenum cofactor biosynthesis protein [Mycolicibacterium sp. TUM20984]